MRVLVAEDDTHIREGLVELLEEEGYDVLAASDGEEALRRFAEMKPDFVCLDVMMPKSSGYDVCREIRKTDEQTPIIFISAKSEEIDKVLGLELGGDDFIVKPFGVKEVIARIRAVSRRCLARSTDTARTEPFEMDDLTISPAELRARRGDLVIELSLRDLQLLRLLHGRAGEAISREAIFNEVWGSNHLPNSRTIDQHISQLRKRIEQNPKEPRIIRTVHGAGYRYEAK